MALLYRKLAPPMMWVALLPSCYGCIVQEAKASPHEQMQSMLSATFTKISTPELLARVILRDQI